LAEEIIDIVNKNGEVLRQAAKSEAHQHGWLHKTVIGYLRDGEDWILVCQAADRQDAGQLVAPVAGHVQAGETEPTPY
jgi:isopentenyldiphosphate isomerase